METAGWRSESVTGWNPIIENVSRAFPDVEYTTILYISTLPTITYVLAALIAGWLVGKKTGYKRTLISGAFKAGDFHTD